MQTFYIALTIAFIFLIIFLPEIVTWIFKPKKDEYQRGYDNADMRIKRGEDPVKVYQDFLDNSWDSDPYDRGYLARCMESVPEEKINDSHY